MLSPPPLIFSDLIIYCSPGRVITPVSTTAATSTPPSPPPLSDFSSKEVLGRVCQDVLDYTQPLIPSLQTQLVGEEVSKIACLSTPSLSLFCSISHSMPEFSPSVLINCCKFHKNCYLISLPVFNTLVSR